MNKKEGNITTYKFSDLIEEVVEFNSDNRYGLDDIVGVTIEKGLIPTIANLTQTALDKFYLVRPKTFVYNPRTHGVRLGMGYNETANTYITSWNNVAFKVKSKAENIVLSKYLWLYFCRPDWDRQTNFLAWGSSTIVFAWKDFLDIEVPLPPISEQRAIVADYEAVARRIAVAKRTIATLQATAQTLYRKMFVDGIDKENLPEGWRWGKLGEVAKITMGQSPDGETYNEEGNGMIFYQGRTDFGFRFPSIRMYTTDPTRFAKKGDVLLSVRAPVGDLNIAPHDCCIGRGLASIREKHNCQSYIYYLLMSLSDVFNVSDGDGTIFGSITKDELYGIKVILPDDDLILKFDEQCAIIDKQIELHSKEIEKLTEIQSLLLAGIA